MKGRYAVTYHPQAGEDFDLIDEFITGYAGEVASAEIINSIKSKISKLTDFPRIGTVRDEISPGLRAFPVTEKAIVCFTIDDDTQMVKIICITYAGQDWQKIARSREGAA